MSREQFDKTFGGLVENTPWVLERAYAQRPFNDTLALRSAFHDALLTGSPEEQLRLMNSFADLGSEEEASDAYMLDHANAGIDGLMDKERSEVLALARAYRQRFNFPLIVCAREVDRYERVLSSGWHRLANAPGVERAAGLIEIAKIASYRFDELVANANPIASAQLDRFAKATA
jgi:OHCU decarboxylase